MSKTVRYIMYVVIMIICVMAIFVGVYSLESKNASKKEQIIDVNELEEKTEKKTEETTTQKFKKLFTNEFFNSQYKATVKKINPDKDIVYAETETINDNENYSLDVHLPIINIDTELGKEFNNRTIRDCVSKRNALKSQEDIKEYTIYDTSFTSYVNNDILSVAIMVSLKEGNNAQRVFVKTYNYNLKTDKEVSIMDVLEERGIDSTSANKKINSEIKKVAEEAESMSSSGYNVYKRNPEDEMYDVKNVKTFIQGPNGELYVIYAYGDRSNTAEMDVIEIKND